MSTAPGGRLKHWSSRRVCNGSVAIDGRTYRPVSSDVPYVGQLDGHRCMFRLHFRPDGSTSEFVMLWGTWDPDGREYRDDVGPHVVAGRCPFAVWFAVEELP